MKISDVMNKAFVIEPKISIKEAAKMMSNRGVGSLIVMKGSKVEGIVTDSDILKNVSSLGKRVSDVMSKNVVTIEKSNSLDEAAELMAQKKVKRLPVISKGELVGIITATDILAHSDGLNEDFFFD